MFKNGTVIPNAYMVLLLALILYVLGSCKKADERRCVKSSGSIITEGRSLESFNRIELRDNINLIIIPDTINFMHVEAPENLMKFIISDVQGQNLVIRNDNRCNWLRSFENDISVRLHLKTLEGVEIRGMGDIKNEGFLQSDIFHIDAYAASGNIDLQVQAKEIHVKIHNGPSFITVKGTGERAYVYNAGEGYIFMQNFTAQQSFVVHNGTGDCHIKAERFLDISLEYVGDVYYYGQPDTLNKTITGSGRIHKK